ncbi:MAG: hypothetical protein NZ522_02265, partial [Chitinophagales bacterium]|nr:hypothetical protein [Chitinophagales bacterium]
DEVQRELRDATQQVVQLQERVQQLEVQVQNLQKYKEWMERCGFRVEDSCPPKNCPEPPKTTFMAISTSWQNQGPYDVDLWIREPGGKFYSYQNTTHAGLPGILSVDSKQGPGVELFEILNPPPGEYLIYLNLYAGNTAQANLRIFYQKGIKEFENINLQGPNMNDVIGMMRFIQKILVLPNGEFEFHNN